MKPAPPTSPLEKLCEGVIEAGWLAALAAVPLFFDPYSHQIFDPDKTALLHLIVLLMAAVWAIKVAGGGRIAAPIAASAPARPRRVPLLVPSLFLLMSSTLSAAWSVDPGDSFAGSYYRAQGLVTAFAYVAFFLLVLAHLRSARQWRRLAYVVTLASFAASAYAVLQYLKLDPIAWQSAGPRVGSTLGNPVFLAAFLCLTFLPIAGELSRSAGVEAVPRPAAAAAPELRFPSRILVVYTLLLQIVAILLSRSRGPLLALLTGSFLGLLAVLLAMRAAAAPQARWRALRRWGWLMLIGAAGVTLSAFWAMSAPGAGQWRRELGLSSRLAAPFEMRSGSAKARLLTWEGGLDLLREGSPIAGESEVARTVRRWVGYGPETFRLVFASHDTATRAGAERARVADRSHNEMLDRLVETGLVGFVVWSGWFGTLLFIGAIGLFPQGATRTGLYWSLVLCGAALGAAMPALLGAPHFAFFAVPLGMLAGLALFLGLLSRHCRAAEGAPAWTTRQSVIAVLLASAAAHLVEIHLGIGVVATRLYLWCFAAVLVAVQQGWLELEPAVQNDDRESVRAPATMAGLIAGLVIATLIFPLLANPDRATTLLALLVGNFTNRGGLTPVGGALWLPILVWVAAATAVGLDGGSSAGRSKVAATFAGTCLVVGSSFLLLHAHRLARVATLEAEARPLSEVLDEIAGHEAAFFGWVVLWILGAGLLLWRLPGTAARRAAGAGFCPRPWRAAGVAAVLAAAAVPVVGTTLASLKADSLLKHGVSRVEAGDLDSGLPILRRAAAAAPRRAIYEVELGRALAAAAQATPPGPERERWFSEAVLRLERARSLSPLDPESWANLGSLFAIGSDLAVDEETRRARLDRAAAELEHSLELHPEWVHWMAALAVVEHHRGNQDRAFALTDRALALHPKSWRAHRALAQLHTLEAEALEAAGEEEAARDHRSRAADVAQRLSSLESLGNRSGRRRR